MQHSALYLSTIFGTSVHSVTYRNTCTLSAKYGTERFSTIFADVMCQNWLSWHYITQVVCQAKNGCMKTVLCNLWHNFTLSNVVNLCANNGSFVHSVTYRNACTLSNKYVTEQFSIILADVMYQKLMTVISHPMAIHHSHLVSSSSVALMMSAMGFKLSIPLHSVSDFTSRFLTPPLNIMTMYANCMLTVWTENSTLQDWSILLERPHRLQQDLLSWHVQFSEHQGSKFCRWKSRQAQRIWAYYEYISNFILTPCLCNQEKLGCQP